MAILSAPSNPLHRQLLLWLHIKPKEREQVFTTKKTTTEFLFRPHVYIPTPSYATMVSAGDTPCYEDGQACCTENKHLQIPWLIYDKELLAKNIDR